MTVTFSAVRKFPCHNVTKITPKKKSCDNGGYLLGHNHHIASMGQQEKKKAWLWSICQGIPFSKSNDTYMKLSLMSKIWAASSVSLYSVREETQEEDHHRHIYRHVCLCGSWLGDLDEIKVSFLRMSPTCVAALPWKRHSAYSQRKRQLPATAANVNTSCHTALFTQWIRLKTPQEPRWL